MAATFGEFAVMRLVCLLVCLGPLAAPESSRIHPADGPDVDVRVRITSQAVRFNVIVNLAFMDEIIEPAREDDSSLHPVEYAGTKADLFEYFKKHNKVTIDGVEVTPTAGDFDVEPADLSLVPNFPRMGAKALVKVRLGLDYSAKSAPETVAMVWGPFPPDVVLTRADGTIPPIEVSAQLNARGNESVITFTKEEPEYVWHASDSPPVERFLPVPKASAPSKVELPVISIGLAALGVLGAALSQFSSRWRRRRRLVLGLLLVSLGAAALLLDVGRMSIEDPFGEGDGLPNEEQALAIFRPLHVNIYRAFDLTEESEIYDALARSVDGELLDDLYNEIYKSLIMQDQGGAVSRVKKVTPVRTEIEKIGRMPPADAPGFQVKARWRVLGEVFHWGHSHRRLNEYEARYSVVGGDRGWRIAGNQVLEQFRVELPPEEAGEDK